MRTPLQESKFMVTYPNPSQGSTWSPLIFALFLEPQAPDITQNDKIKGSEIN